MSGAAAAAHHGEDAAPPRSTVLVRLTAVLNR